MTNLSRSIKDLDTLIDTIDAHKDKDELIQLINEQVTDDTYKVLN